MKFYALLVLLCFTAAVVADEKINLEDIERDNLQSEAHSEEESAPGPEEQKYNSDKADGNANVRYQTEARVIGGQQSHDIKYVTEPQDYSRGLDAYSQQQHQQFAAQQAQLSQQYYTPSYQAESQVSYQPQLQVQALNYQSALPVANHIQNYEQKTSTEKFVQGIDKGNHYATVGGTQQLLYYPTQSVAANSKSQIQPLLHRLASQAAQNVQLESYDQSLDESTKLSYQQQPQIQYVYEPQYVQQAVTPAVAAKGAQKYVYATIPQAYSTQQAYSGLTYAQQPNSVYNHQPKQAYTQAYFVQPQSPQISQYYQLPAYTSGLGHQSNSLSYSQSQPLYVSSNIAQQLASQIYGQQGSHSISQNYAKIPQEPHYTLAPPQHSAQKFRNGPVTYLRPVHSGVSHIKNNQIHYPHYSSGPKSLLDSYTPSLVIAAQDSERYRERPLQLESGFLPSKGAYAHSYNQKRKSD